MPTGAGRVMLDMFNEPDIFALQWERRIIYQGILYPSLPELLLPAMRARAASACRVGCKTGCCTLAGVYIVYHTLAGDAALRPCRCAPPLRIR